VISEDDFKKKIVDYAHDNGWVVFHPIRGNRDGRWYTAQQGDNGYPDLTMARGGRIVILELKRHQRYATLEQERWLTALSGIGWSRDRIMIERCGDGYERINVIGCVHPKDWPGIKELLA
jgi:hypothetical protein